MLLVTGAAGGEARGGAETPRCAQLVRRAATSATARSAWRRMRAPHDRRVTRDDARLSRALPPGCARFADTDGRPQGDTRDGAPAPNARGARRRLRRGAGDGARRRPA